MIRLSLIAATGLAIAMSGLAAMPASASQTVGNFCASDNPEITKNIDMYAALLKQQGVEASDLRQWGGCIQAFVTGSDGHTHLAYFDPLTLKEIPLDVTSLKAG